MVFYFASLEKGGGFCKAKLGGISRKSHILIQNIQVKPQIPQSAKLTAPFLREPVSQSLNLPCYYMLNKEFCQPYPLLTFCAEGSVFKDIGIVTETIVVSFSIPLHSALNYAVKQFFILYSHWLIKIE